MKKLSDSRNTTKDLEDSLGHEIDEANNSSDGLEKGDRDLTQLSVSYDPETGSLAISEEAFNDREKLIQRLSEIYKGLKESKQNSPEKCFQFLVNCCKTFKVSTDLLSRDSQASQDGLIEPIVDAALKLKEEKILSDQNKKKIAEMTSHNEQDSGEDLFKDLFSDVPSENKSNLENDQNMTVDESEEPGDD